MNGYVKDLPEEERLQNLLESVTALLEHDPVNEYWMNIKASVQIRLGEIYNLKYAALLRDSMDFYQTRECHATAGHPI